MIQDNHFSMIVAAELREKDLVVAVADQRIVVIRNDAADAEVTQRHALQRQDACQPDFPVVAVRDIEPVVL